VSEHLNSSTIQQYLAEVADELPVDGTQRVVVLVGGALLAWHDLRDATRDVDSGSRLDSEIVAAVLESPVDTDLLGSGSTTPPLRSCQRPSTGTYARYSSTLQPFGSLAPPGISYF
jgi:hypothetical protein